MSAFAIHIASEPREYSGAELRSHFAYTTYGLLGDSGVAFVGRCSVGEAHMVDVEDLRARDFIKSDRMLHFIVEHFEERLTTMVLRQRLLARLAAERLESLSGARLMVRGDDLYLGDGKNQKIYVLERESLQILTTFGDGGRQPGQFFAVHSIATDSKGNLFTTETYEGRRLQKFVYKGLGPVTKLDQGTVWPAK